MEEPHQAPRRWLWGTTLPVHSFLPEVNGILVTVHYLRVHHSSDPLWKVDINFVKLTDSLKSVAYYQILTYSFWMYPVLEILNGIDKSEHHRGWRVWDQPLLSQPRSDPGVWSARGPPEIWVIRARWWEAAPPSPALPQLQRSRRTEQCSPSVNVFRDLSWILHFRSSTSELTGKWTRSSPGSLRGSWPRANPSRRQRRRTHSGFFVVLESSACRGREIRCPQLTRCSCSR